MLHVHPGDSSANALRKAGVEGEVITWFDPLWEGPAPAAVDDDEWHRLRAEYVHEATDGQADFDGQWLHDQNAALETWYDHDEIVLWFDACLFDQVILIRHLDYFATQDLGDRTLSLICIDKHPEVDNFKGLGELKGKQLAALLPDRHKVTTAEYELGQAAWTAFRSPDPRDIEKLLTGDCRALPYLTDALHRHLQRFPSVHDGLNRLEQEVLRAVAAGSGDFRAIWDSVNRAEKRPFFGDMTLWSVIDELASPRRNPLLEVIGAGPVRPHGRRDKWGSWQVGLTPLGRRVLGGVGDWIDLNGIDRWIGGVHLDDKEPIWRWNDDEGVLVLTEPED